MKAGPETKSETAHFSALTRRSFVIAAAGMCAASAVGSAIVPAFAQSESADMPGLVRSPQFDAAYAKLVGNATPVEGKIAIELPEIAENGNFVPVTLTVESPMTADDHVKAIHLLSTANPVAHVATFKLSPVNGVARVQSRMRLAKTQDVIALAEQSNGSLVMATLLVKVTLGGCAS